MNKRPHIIAALATLLFCIIVVSIMLSTKLFYSSLEEAQRQWPPVDSAELLFANEYVAAGEIMPVPNPSEASPVAQSAPNLNAHDRTDAGEAADATPEPVTSEQSSPLAINKPKENVKKGPTKEEIEAERKAKAQKEAAEAISKRVNFGGKAAGGEGEGAPEANGSGGSADGIASASVGGRTMEKWSKPTARDKGTIIVRVSVDRHGKVVRADYVSGTGAVATNSAARQNCENAAMKSQFSVDLNGPATQIGTITYRFK